MTLLTKLDMFELLCLSLCDFVCLCVTLLTKLDMFELLCLSLCDFANKIRHV